MSKSADAFRTISEVAELLDTPTHVLRFWESRFPQIKPVKRAGGRRYYRPDDVALLGGIKHMLRQEGMTIRGVQQLIKAEGPRPLMALGGYDESMPGEEEAAEELGALDAAPEAPAADLPEVAPEPWAAAPDAPESTPFPADPEEWPPEAAPEAWPADPEDALAQDAPGFAPAPEPETAAEWPAAAPEPPPQDAATPADMAPSEGADWAAVPPEEGAAPRADADTEPWLSAGPGAEPGAPTPEAAPWQTTETGAAPDAPAPEALSWSPESGFWPADPEDAPGAAPETEAEAEAEPAPPRPARRPTAPAWRQASLFDAEFDPEGEAPMALDVEPDEVLEVETASVVALYPASAPTPEADPEDAPVIDALAAETEDALAAFGEDQPPAAPEMAAEDGTVPEFTPSTDPEAPEPGQDAPGEEAEADLAAEWVVDVGAEVDWVAEVDAELGGDVVTEPDAEVEGEGEVAAEPEAEGDPEPEPEPAPVPPGPPPVTLPERLRALDPAALSALERVKLIGLRDRLVALRGRIEAPVRGPEA